MSVRAWAGLMLAVSLGMVDAGASSALAFHAATDVPLQIAPEDVQRYREAGEEVVLIDLRPADAFHAGHLSKARSVPLGEVRRREPEIPHAGRVVLYAGTPEEAAAAYQALREAGHRNVMVLAGGLPAWVRLGLPMETSR